MANTGISNLINSQVPFFVRNDHPQFIKFLEAYYKFLEQDEYAVDIQKNIRNLQDIDYQTRNDTPSALDNELLQKTYNTYLNLLTQDIKVDKALLLKHAKDFYVSKGSEKSMRFLLNILYNEENVDFYYPKKTY
jgi:hypothetical protein